MALRIKTWPKRFVRWLFGSPFQRLPPQYGNTVPTDLQRFEAEAQDAERHGLGQVAGRPPSPHTKVKPARRDEALERQ